jgi:NADH-quinone oxidoreductase subunit B
VAVRFPAGPYTLWVLDVGLACCAVEVVAASMRVAAEEQSRPPDVMVVAGTLTDKMAPAIKGLYDSLPDPKYVISFGACSNCGGPYWDSYSVTKGVDQIVPVDVYVPGCPPRPEALLDGLRRLEELGRLEERGRPEDRA